MCCGSSRDKRRNKKMANGLDSLTNDFKTGRRRFSSDGGNAYTDSKSERAFADAFYGASNDRRKGKGRFGMPYQVEDTRVYSGLGEGTDLMEF
ncbi:hypothetical protein IL306_009515 [Fusarium sp. DS 682]|nr:hypothetical protein IL306_009515 [Fusarium sp. DS 682]